MDIDHFKQVNDQHGHAAGDMALAAFANIVADTLRSADTFGRWGGEEFVAVLPETTVEDAFAAAERIRATVAVHRFATFGRDRLTCSIGIAVCPEDATAPDALIAAADQAMYAAKRLGRNRCETAAALGAETPRHQAPDRAGAGDPDAHRPRAHSTAD